MNTSITTTNAMLVTAENLVDIHAHVAGIKRECLYGYIVAVLLSTGEVHTHEFKYLESAIDGLNELTNNLSYDVNVRAVVML